MPVELDILKQVCGQLDVHGIPYMLTGSFAANFYAVPRMTRDIDIVIEIQINEVNKIFQIFKNDFYIDRTAIDDAIKHQDMFNIIHNEFSFKIDFIIRKNDEYRLVEFERKKRIQLDNVSIWIVSPEDLIISKLYWAKDSQSEMQIKDVKNLLSTMHQLDHDYIRKWVKKLNLAASYDKVYTHE
jgi:predicted nucleotidyltransferase